MPEKDIESRLARWQSGDPSARDDLITHSCERLRRLTRRLKKDYPVLGRWFETDDIFQQAVMRLYRSLEEVEVQDARGFLALATLQIRRELIDVSRKLKGPHGLAANYETDPPAGPAKYELAADSSETSLEFWTCFHEQVAQLAEPVREVFELTYYHALSRTQVADLMRISETTVKRRLRSAKVNLHDALGASIDP